MSSSDAPLIASCGDCVKVWNATNLQEVGQHNFNEGKVNNLCWNRDNAILCSSSSNGEKIILSGLHGASSNFKKMGQIDDINGYICMKMNRHGRKLFVSDSKCIKEWDLNTISTRRVYQHHQRKRGGSTNPMTCLGLSKNENYIATASNKENEISLIDTTTTINEQIKVCENEANVRSIEFSPWIDHQLGMGLDDGVVSIWDVSTKSQYHQYHHHKGPSTSISFSPFNHLLLASAGIDKQLILYDTKIKAFVQSCAVSEPLMSLALLHDGFSMFVGSSLGTIYQFDMRKFGSVINKKEAAHSTAVHQIICQNQIRSTSKPSSRHHQVKQATPTTNNKSNPPTNLEPDEKLRRFWSHKTSVSSDNTSSSVSKSTSLSGKEAAYKPVNETPSANTTTSTTDQKRISLSSERSDTSTVGGFVQLSNLGNDTFSSFDDDCISPTATRGPPFLPTDIPAATTARVMTSHPAAGTQQTAVSFGSPMIKTSTPEVAPHQPTPPSTSASFMTSQASNTPDLRLTSSTATIKGDGDRNAVGGRSLLPRSEHVSKVMAPQVGAEEQHNFNIKLLNEIVQKSETRIRDEVNERMKKVHVHLAKMTMKLEDEIVNSRCNCSLNEHLLMENLRLKEEVERLKRKY